jgi:DNA-binding transcriptional ArsR family regulator
VPARATVDRSPEHRLRVDSARQCSPHPWPLNGVYHAPADASRRPIVWCLAAEGELKVTELATPFDMSLNPVSKHSKVLEGTGLVQRRVAGRDHRLSLESEPLAAAYSWIGLYQRFWERRVDDLVEHLEARASRGD